MSEFYYSTDSEEHLINIGEKQEPQWDKVTEEELWEDIDKAYIQDILMEDGCL